MRLQGGGGGDKDEKTNERSGHCCGVIVATHRHNERTDTLPDLTMFYGSVRHKRLMFVSWDISEGNNTCWGFVDYPVKHRCVFFTCLCQIYEYMLLFQKQNSADS